MGSPVRFSPPPPKAIDWWRLVVTHPWSVSMGVANDDEGTAPTAFGTNPPTSFLAILSLSRKSS